MTGNIDVIVIGGGYAGTMAANRITQRDDVTVTLINPRPDFVERLRLHQLVGGSDDAVVNYREVLADSIKLVIDTATRIDTVRRSVILASGGAIQYDYLIYAVGSGSTNSDVPGASEFAYPIATLEEAQQLSQVLAAAPATAAVTVVGAGPAGIETAAELAEVGRSITLVCGGVLGPYMHPRARRSLAKRLVKLGVTLVEGPDTRVTAVTRDAVQLASGRVLPSTLTIWTTGFGIPNLACRSGLSTDTVGRLITDETLTSIDDVRIVAAGDCAAPSNLPLRMSAQAAQPLGSHAADTVLSRIAGKQPASINIAVLSQCISLGRHSGVYQFASRQDIANKFYLSGGIVAWIKEASCKWVVAKLIQESRKPGSYTWPFKNHKRREAVAKFGERPTTGHSGTATALTSQKVDGQTTMPGCRRHA
jgi:NADH dehydrogenase FAD-containing subunit